MTPSPETRACKGGETCCGQTMTEHVEQCQACGMAVPCDLIDHPFFGFEAGCPKAEEENPQPQEIPGKLEMYDGKLREVVDASRSGWWRFHRHYDRDGYCDNPARGY